MFRFIKRILSSLGETGVIHLIPLLLLLAGIIGGVYLVQKGGYQIFKPKAASNSIEFERSNGQDPDNCVTTDQNGEKTTSCAKVRFRLTPPSDSKSSVLPKINLVKEAYAQTSSSSRFPKPILSSVLPTFTGKNYQCNLEKTQIVEYAFKTPVSSTPIASPPKIFGISLEFKIPLLNWGIVEQLKAECSKAGAVCAQAGDTTFCTTQPPDIKTGIKDDVRRLSAIGDNPPKNRYPVYGEIVDIESSSDVQFFWEGGSDKTVRYRFIMDSSEDTRKGVAGKGCPANYNSDYFICSERYIDNTPIIHQDLTRHGYNLGGGITYFNAKNFEDGKSYSWWVDAIDKDGNPLGSSADFPVTIQVTTKRSDPFCFGLQANVGGLVKIAGGSSWDKKGELVRPGDKIQIDSYLANVNRGKDQIVWFIDPNEGSFPDNNYDHVTWQVPDKNGNYDVSLNINNQHQTDCVANFRVTASKNNPIQPPPITQPPPVPAPNCPNKEAQPYTQCGKTTGLEDKKYSSDHLYKITPIADCNDNVVGYKRPPEDLGVSTQCQKPISTTPPVAIPPKQVTTPLPPEVAPAAPAPAPAPAGETNDTGLCSGRIYPFRDISSDNCGFNVVWDLEEKSGLRIKSSLRSCNVFIKDKDGDHRISLNNDCSGGTAITKGDGRGINIADGQTYELFVSNGSPGCFNQSKGKVTLNCPSPTSQADEPLDSVVDSVGKVFCPDKTEEYPQCGGTFGLEDKDPTHTYMVRRVLDCNDKIKRYILPPLDLDDLGQCQQKVEDQGKVTPKCSKSDSIGDIIHPQASCVLNLRPDVLKYYMEQGGWCGGNDNLQAIVNDWYNKLANQNDKNKVASCFPKPGSSDGLQKTVTGYRFAETPTDLINKPFLPFTPDSSGGMLINYQFSDPANGPHFIYAQFQINESSSEIVNANPFPTRIMLAGPSIPSSGSSGDTNVSPQILYVDQFQATPTTTKKDSQGAYSKIQITIKGANKRWILYFNNKEGRNCGGSCSNVSEGWSPLFAGEQGTSTVEWIPYSYLKGVHTIALIDTQINRFIVGQDITFEEQANTPITTTPTPLHGSACSAYETTSICGGGIKTYDRCFDNGPNGGGSTDNGTLCATGGTQFYCVGSTNSSCDTRYDTSVLRVVEGTYQYSCSQCSNIGLIVGD